MAKVSVIVPVYNTEQYLEKCLDSLVNQTLEDIEIIIINDGSTDDSKKKIELWEKKDKRIKLYNKENGGQASARNLGLSVATGEYIAFLDSDDYVSNEMYNLLYQEAKKDDFDIEAVTKAIEKDYKPETIRLTSYEEEQENNAVISYEELLKNKDKISVSYDDEYEFEEPTLSVKKFDLTNTSETPVIDESKLKVQLMSYEKEEEFLKALKDLQSNLSH